MDSRIKKNIILSKIRDVLTEIRPEIKIGHILTSGDLELDPIKLNLFSSDRCTINLYFDGSIVAVG